jgi:hypothetical protein
VGISQGRHRLEVRRGNHLQAARHRQQGRQLPSQCRADVGRHHPAAEPGCAADGGTLAESERGCGVRRGPTPFGYELGETAGR